MEVGDGIIMLATPTPIMKRQKKHREHCEGVRKWSHVPWVIGNCISVRAGYRCTL